TPTQTPAGVRLNGSGCAVASTPAGDWAWAVLLGAAALVCFRPRAAGQRVLLLVLGTGLMSSRMAHGSPACSGDCDGSGSVEINECGLITNMVLGSASLADCPAADANGDGQADVEDVVSAVEHALDRCPLPLTAIAGPTQALARAVVNLPAIAPLVSL